VAGSPTKYRFTVKDYHRMAEAEVFAPDDRVELFRSGTSLSPGPTSCSCVTGPISNPMPAGIHLAVEVADNSLRYDLGRKAPLYLAGGVPEVWVIDLAAAVVHVGRGGQVVQLSAGESVAPHAFPDLVLEVAAILG
jgi:hypothetical protein